MICATNPTNTYKKIESSILFLLYWCHCEQGDNPAKQSHALNNPYFPALFSLKDNNVYKFSRLSMSKNSNA